MSGIAHPRLLPGVRLVEQTYRGETSVLARTPDGGKFFRFRPVEARVLAKFDGLHTPVEIAKALGAEGVRVGAAAVEGFARQLASLGIVERSLAERSNVQLERLREERHRRRRGAADLMRMRKSIGDPDAFLNRTLPMLRFCFTRRFVIASAALFALYVGILIARWPTFSAQVAANYLPATIGFDGALLLWLATVTVTVIHEFGHGYACKAFGGEVHEIGVMLIYFQPAMYCNVNDAWSFPDRSARLWVTAAGTWIQLIVTSFAAIVWWAVEPSTFLSHAALAVMIVGGVTSVLTNANPLIPLDGYYALSDWLDLPNMRQRASAYFAWWMQTHVMRVTHPEPVVTPRERRILLTYGAFAAVYRTVLLVTISFVVVRFGGQRFGATGAVLALAWLALILRGPARKLLANRAMLMRRLRALRSDRWRRRGTRIGLTIALALLVVLVLPWPTTVVGTFEATPTHAQIATAPSAGVVAEVLVRGGERVVAGTPLVRVVDPAVAEALGAATYAVAAFADSERVARARGDADVSRLAASRAAAEARLLAVREADAGALVRARRDGVILTTRPDTLLGLGVDAGAPLLRLGDADSLELRIALGGGAGRVRVGQRVRLFSDADAADAREATLATVAPADGTGGVEARARVAAGFAWRTGVHGEARVTVARTTVAGALLWNVRTRLRGDLLL